MYEIDFLPVGKAKPGDAIAMRFTHPTTGQWVHVIIDAGYQDDGDVLVNHVKTYYGTDAIDLVILTHPDGDHIGGMGKVVRNLKVKELWLHQIGAHGGESLRAHPEVEDLISVATQHGVTVYEVWAGKQAFDGAFTVLGPDKAYYEQLVAEQVSGPGLLASLGKALVEAARGVYDRVTDQVAEEIPFGEGEVNPRNNSSMICLLQVDGQRLLFTADAGVPALERAWDKAESMGVAGDLAFVQVPHHGSRRNCSSAWLDRLLGPIGQPGGGTAFASVPSNSEKHPSGKVVNAYARRGYPVIVTAGESKSSRHQMPARQGWVTAYPLGPMVEEDD
jgi:beta-lactamase superfamily II metal-dependent hydrolase